MRARSWEADCWARRLAWFAVSRARRRAVRRAWAEAKVSGSGGVGVLIALVGLGVVCLFVRGLVIGLGVALSSLRGVEVMGNHILVVISLRFRGVVDGLASR